MTTVARGSACGHMAISSRLQHQAGLIDIR
jgi:hypothetical protein